MPPTSPQITRPLPNGVTYTLPLTPPSPSSSQKTTISLPAHSTWTSGLHWHETHTEYLHLVRGSISVRLNNDIKILRKEKGSESDMIVKVDRGVRHEWGRVAVFTGQEDTHEEEVVVEEWTDPSDGEKGLFFWNLNGVINAAASGASRSRSESRVRGWWMEIWVMVQLFVIFRELDNWPVFFDLGGMLREKGVGLMVMHGVEWFVTHGVLLSASLVGKMLGLEAVTKERTPDEVWKGWIERKETRKAV